MHHAGEATDGEHRDETDREQHRRRKVQLAAPHRGGPVQDLHARGHRNEHRRERERGHRDRPDTGHEHVMGPYAPAHKANGDTGEHDEWVTKDRLTSEGRKNF